MRRTEIWVYETIHFLDENQLPLPQVAVYNWTSANTFAASGGE
jgi:hypothetical protein